MISSSFHVDQLTEYIFTYCQHLMTPEERAAQRSLIGDLKIQGTSSSPMQESLRKFWMSDDPRVLELLADGPEAFRARVRTRIMQDPANDVVFNYCPRCGALARTPKAKQCPQCFFSWHDAA